MKKISGEQVLLAVIIAVGIVSILISIRSIHQSNILMKYASFSLGCEQAGNPSDYCHKQAILYIQTK
jgi:hypothetical protein